MKTIYTLTSILLFSVVANCQELTPNFIALSVKDIDAQQKWYCEKLAFKVKKAVATVAPGIRFGMLEGNGMAIELIEDKKSESKTSTSDALPHGLFKFGFRVNDINKLLEVLASKGVKPKFGPFKATPADPANFIIEDPEGNLIQFFAVGA